MTLEEQRYYEEILATLKTPGWKYLLEDWKEQKDARSTLTGIATLEQLWFNKGVVDNITYLEGLREVFEDVYTKLQELPNVESE